jgi:hypothetical protein
LPKVVFCTTCKDRTQHLELTLPVNLKNNPDAKFVVVNYNSQDHFESYIRESHAAEIESGQLSVYRFTEPIPFRMAHAKNLAHRLGILQGGDILVNLDADNLTGPGFAAYLASQNWDNRFHYAIMKKGEMRRGISGRIAATKDAYLLAGGYDEIYQHWGSDDKDFHRRLNELGFTGESIPREFLDAITHNDKMRFREYPHLIKNPPAYDDVNPGRELTIANWGKFGCGVLYKNFSAEPIELQPVPTRIFGIGMHKTGTTSLHHAFETLGYDSAHWKTAHWAKAIWDEMKAEGRSSTLEKSYAFCDLPFPLLYRELDAAYPGSKFILTIRGEEEWLESVRAHWSPKNPWRTVWDTDPFTHRIHRLLYGRMRFDKDVFLDRYRRHNAEVLEYFKYRTQDLLVFDVSTGWYPLCGFLRQRVPGAPFPHSMKTRA